MFSTASGPQTYNLPPAGGPGHGPPPGKISMQTVCISLGLHIHVNAMYRMLCKYM